jgi:hypothetical protein
MGIPVFDISRLIEWGIKGIATGFLWIAAKVVLSGLILTFVPLAIYYAITKLAEHTFNAASGMAPTGGMWDGAIIQYSGLAGWLATQLRMPECFALYMGAIAVSFALSFLRKV